MPGSDFVSWNLKRIDRYCEEAVEEFDRAYRLAQNDATTYENLMRQLKH
jgi:hypothetical protein